MRPSQQATLYEAASEELLRPWQWRVVQLLDENYDHGLRGIHLTFGERLLNITVDETQLHSAG